MNIIYKGLQRSQIRNVGLASTFTFLYGDISNHYALRLDNTGARVIEVYPSLLCNRMSEHVDLYIK